MTLKNLQVDDLIVQIPNTLLVTKDRVLRDFPLLNSYTLTTAEALTLFLLYCKKESINHIYTSLLPEEFSIAAMCTLEEIATLPQNLQTIIIDSKDYYVRKYKKVATIWEEVNRCKLSAKDFTWAWCAVNTRAVYYKDTTDVNETLENNMALAPYLDMLNHNSEARISAGYNFETGCYEIRTLQPVKCYGEVFINYGSHDNVKLFVEYGFVIPKNPQAVVEFDISLMEKLFSIQLSESTLKKQLLGQLALNNKIFCSRDGLSWDAQVALTIIVTPESMLTAVKTPYDVDVSSEDVFVNSMSGSVIRELLCHLKECQEKGSKLSAPTQSFCVAKCLIQDMLDILSLCLC